MVTLRSPICGKICKAGLEVLRTGPCAGLLKTALSRKALKDNHHSRWSPTWCYRPHLASIAPKAFYDFTSFERSARKMALLRERVLSLAYFGTSARKRPHSCGHVRPNTDSLLSADPWCNAHLRKIMTNRALIWRPKRLKKRWDTKKALSSRIPWASNDLNAWVWFPIKSFSIAQTYDNLGDIEAVIKGLFRCKAYQVDLGFWEPVPSKLELDRDEVPKEFKLL